MKKLRKILYWPLIVKWLITTKSLTLSKKIFMVINFAILSQNGVVLDYSDPESSKVIDLIKKIKNEVKAHLEINEAYQLFMSVKGTTKIGGDIAEVGVYREGSSKIICEAKGKKALHLFDTFEGLPELSKKDDSRYFHRGEFHALFEEVKRYLRGYSNIYLYKGIFPDIAGPIKNKKFSFVHLDVDIYKSTLDCLKFFYSRMNKGGIIISHDYINAVGVRKAFDEFFKNKREPIIEMSGSQCLIVKL